MYIHLQHRRHERFLASLITLKHLGAEAPLPILRYTQLDVPHACDEHSVVMTGSVPESARCSLPFACLQRFVYLGFQHLLQRLFDNHLQQIPIFRQ